MARTRQEIIIGFQSTLPGWGATATTLAVEPVPVQFQSTLPGWGATPNPVIRSIRKTNFNPRSPDGERRSLLSLVLSEMRFQSTLPGWGATFNVIGDVGAGVFQSTLPGWGATQQRRHPVQQGRISIHAPRVGSDRENGHLRPRYGQNHPFSTLIVSQIVINVLGTVRKSQKHQRTSHYEVIKQPERRK